MPKTHHIIKSFNAGELSPLMDARSDQEKYAFGCRTMENFIPLIYGGAERRPGTQYVSGCISNSAKSRVVAFEHSVTQTYILEFGNQTLRIFTGGTSPSIVYKPYGTETLSGVGTPVAHWKCDDNAANTTVVDATGNHNGVASANTSNLTSTDAEGTANAAFDLADTYYVTVTDHADFTFGDGTDDSPFSALMWVYYVSGGNNTLLSKYSAGNFEWRMTINGATNKISFLIFDDSANASHEITTTDTLTTATWYFIAFTYNGLAKVDGATGLKIYVDRVEWDTTLATSGTYVAMENKGANVLIGSQQGTVIHDGKIDNVSIWNKELSATEIASLTGNDSTTAYSITTPYLTADLFDLKFEQSADVMYITHPSYEPRKLLRYGNSTWVLEALDLQTGPFLDENVNLYKTITPSATTGSITLTAAGFSPFISGTTAGHLPSGATSTSKSQTGALFKLVQAAGTPNLSAELDATTLNNASGTISVPKGVSWDFTTNGTWGVAADSATVVLERSYDSGTTYETVVSCTSAANKNITTTGTEEGGDALYRARVSEASASSANNCSIQFSLRDTSHVGIVEIIGVTNSQTATATVLKTLGSTDKTHRWSEGTFSNYRGWPIDVTISAEERLTFAGSVTYPLTTWGSESGDFTNYLLGTNDDDPISFTLVGTGQQNRIRWIVPKDALLIGTVGGVHLLGASKDDEALTPTNVRARLQTTKGSENVTPQIINQAVIYVERGGKKIRELLYDYESDSQKADDLTIFANHITGTGIADMAYQRTPEPMLWCVRSDGQMAVLSYERDQKVLAWSRIVTSDSTSESDFESVAIIYGGANSEDEVWCTVKRTINGSTVRYVERFKSRDWGSNDNDAFFVDSGITYDSTSTSTITGLSHLEGETVQVYADGAKQTSQTVSSGQITLATAASTVQVGLGYTSTLEPMKLDIQGLGRSATMKVIRGVLSLYKTMEGEWGESTSKMNPLRYRKAGQTSAEFPMFTGDIEMEFQGGYNRTGDVIVRQTDPLPMTVVALTLDVGVETD